MAAQMWRWQCPQNSRCSGQQHSGANYCHLTTPRHPKQVVGASSCASLYKEAIKPNGAPYTTKMQLQERIGREYRINMIDSQNGFTRWNGIHSLTRKGWAKRDALSRQYVGGATANGFGGACDRFSITEEGMQVAAYLVSQDTGRPSAATAAAAAAAAAHGRQAQPHDSDDGDEPEFGLAGRSGHAAAATAAAAAAEPRLSFPGRGRMLGGGSGSTPGAAAAAGGARLAAAAAAVAGRAAGGLFDEEERDYVMGFFGAGAGSDSDEGARPNNRRRVSAAATPPPPLPQRRRSSLPARPSSSPATAGVTPRLPPKSNSKSCRPEPLCNCDACSSLAAFADNPGALELPMMLTQKVQQHVRRVVAWLCAVEGGSHHLACAEGPGGRRSLVVRKQQPQQQHAGSGSSSGMQATAAAAAGGPRHNHDPLAAVTAALALRKQQQQQTTTPQRPSLAGSAAAAAGAAGLPVVSEAEWQAGDEEEEDWMTGVDLEQQAALLQDAAATAAAAASPMKSTASSTPSSTRAGAQHGNQTPAELAAAAAEARCAQIQQPQQPNKCQHREQQQQQQETVVIPDSQPDWEMEAALDQQQQQQSRQCCRGRSSEPQDCIFITDSEPADVLAEAAAACPPPKRQRQQHQQQQTPVLSVDLLLDSQPAEPDVAAETLPCRPAKRQRLWQTQPPPPGAPAGEADAAFGSAAPGVPLFAADSQEEEEEEAVPGLLPRNLHHDRPAAAAAAAAAAAGPGGSRMQAAAGAAEHAARAAAAGAAVGAASPPGAVRFELKLLVDACERYADSDRMRIFTSLREEHLRLLPPTLPPGVTIDCDMDSLPLGDYCWLLLDDEESAGGAGSSAATAAAAAAQAAEDSDGDEAAAAAERSACVLAGAVVERKTIQDLVGRSAKGDHLRQLQRMHATRALLPHQLLLIEGLASSTSRCIPYGTGNAPRQQLVSGASSVIAGEGQLYDLFIRAALSRYGADGLRLLLVPGPADSRAFLLAFTQLLLAEQHQQARQRQHQQQQQCPQVQRPPGRPMQQQQEEQEQRMSYPAFRRLCHLVSRQLPHGALPFELRRLPAAPLVPPSSAFSVVRGSGEFAGLQLHAHTSFPLHVVAVEGKQLLVLLDGFYAAAAAGLGLPSLRQRSAAVDNGALQHDGGDDGEGEGEAGSAATAGGPAAAGSLPVLQAVQAGEEVAVLLASLLEAFVQQAVPQQQQQPAAAGDVDAAGACCVLLVQNLLGGTGAISYMSRAQAAAQLGQRRVGKKAAAQQALMCGLDGAAARQYVYLWLLCFVLKQPWHLHLSQSADGAGLFLEAVGSRCAWLAEHGEQRQQQGQRQGVDLSADISDDDSGGDSTGDEEAAERADAAAAAAAGTSPRQKQQQLRRTSGFMEWLMHGVTDSLGMEADKVVPLPAVNDKKAPPAATLIAGKYDDDDDVIVLD